MSKRNEIKQKEELQARFKLSISKQNETVLNWLSPRKDIESNSITNDDDSFMNLKIIPQGSNLNSIDNRINQVQTINEFLNSNNVQKSKDRSRRTQPQSNSKPMNALMNKMRNTNRVKIEQKYKVDKLNQKSSIDEDSEDENLNNKRSVKKGSNGLLFTNKNAKQKRPF